MTSQWLSTYVIPHEFGYGEFVYYENPDITNTRFLRKQACIRVGCIPLACCPYLPACTAERVSAWGGGLVCPGGACPEGVSAHGGCLPGGLSAPKGCLLLGGCLLREVGCLGVLALGGVSANGGCLLLGMSAEGGVPRGCLLSGVSVRGVCIPACTEADTPIPCEHNDR